MAKEPKFVHDNDTVNDAMRFLELSCQGYQKLLEKIASFRVKVRSASMSNEDLIDLQFCIREVREAHESARKECDGLLTMIANSVCARVAQEALTTGSLDDSVKGCLASGTVTIKMAPALPKRDSKDFHDMMEDLGVPRKMAEEKMFHVHWPSLVDLVTERVKKGEALPRGIEPNKTYPVYGVTLRRRPKVSIGFHAASEAPKTQSDERTEDHGEE